MYEDFTFKIIKVIKDKIYIKINDTGSYFGNSTYIDNLYTPRIFPVWPLSDIGKDNITHENFLTYLKDTWKLTKSENVKVGKHVFHTYVYVTLTHRDRGITWAYIDKDTGLIVIMNTTVATTFCKMELVDTNIQIHTYRTLPTIIIGITIIAVASVIVLAFLSFRKSGKYETLR